MAATNRRVGSVRTRFGVVAGAVLSIVGLGTLRGRRTGRSPVPPTRARVTPRTARNR